MTAIRDALPADAAALSRLKLTTFRETFLEDHAVPYPPADLAVFEAQAYGLDRVTADLADPSHHSWVVDGADGELIAYAHVGPCHLPHADVRPGDREIYQLYLRRQAQGSGLGARLLGHVLAWLAQRDADAPVWLGVWSGNLRAQALYRRWGFTVVGEHRFHVGSWVDEELTMRRDAIAIGGGPKSREDS